MKPKIFLKFSILISTILLTSCYSYRPINNSDIKSKFKNKEKEKVYVINSSQFPKEFKILKKSKIYTLIKDSLCKATIKLNSLTKNRGRMCFTGESAVLMITLGQFPVHIYDTYNYSFIKNNNKEEMLVQYQLKIDKRVWFWDLLSFRKSFNSALSKQLKYQEIK